MRLSVLLAFLFTSTVALAADRQINQISVEQSDSDTIIRLFGSDLIRSPKDRVFFAAEASSYSVEPTMMYGDSEYVEVALGMPVMAGQYRISIGPNENTSTLESMVVIGAIGPQGPAGRDGEDGKDGVDGEDGAKGDPGADGKDGTNGINGVNGTNGLDGEDGENGADGSSCSVQEIESGLIVSCTDGTSAVLANSGTVILVPEGLVGEVDAFNYNTGDIVVVDNDGELLARTIPSDTQQIQGFKVDLGFIQNVFWPRAVLYNDTESSRVKLTSYDDGAPPQLWYLTSDCSGPVWLSYDFGVYDGDYFISDPSFPIETLLFGSRRLSDRYTSYDAILPASVCEQVQFSGRARRGLSYSPAIEIINAAYPARLEQLP